MNMGIIAASRLMESIEKVQLIGDDLGGAIGKYVNIELADNDKLYAAPNAASKVLEIDPSTGTTTLIGDDLGSGGSKYRILKKASNGKIYAAPFSASRVLEINP